MELKDRRRGAETGIYIACNDRALLDTINSMMGRRGIVGISDAEGKFHYIVDGRKNSKKAISKIDDIVSHSATVIEGEGSYEHSERNVVYSVVNAAEAGKVVNKVKEKDKEAFVNVIKSERILGRFYQRPTD